MERQQKKHSSWAVSIGVAAVWFGTHVGGGFATGNQTVQYFVRYGWSAIFMPAVVILLLGWCYYQGAVMAKNHDIHRYHEFAEKLYAPFSTAGRIFFDIAFLVLVLVGTGIAIAGAGSLFEELWGLNYYIGILITGTIFFLLTIFGAPLVRRASSVITILILICLLILLVPGISSGWPKTTKFIADKTILGSWKEVIWSALLYAGFQSLVVASIISTSQDLHDNRDCKRFAIVGVIINGVMITLSAIMILGYMPDIQSNTLPIFSIAESIGNPLLLKAYSAILFLAFVSTGVGVVFGLVTRFENAVLKKSGLQTRRVIISLLCIIFAVILSMVGLTKLIAVGYGWIGRVCVFLLVIPLAIVAPIKNKRFKKENN